MTGERRRELSGSVAATRNAGLPRHGRRRVEGESKKHSPARPPRRTSSQQKLRHRPSLQAPPQLHRGHRPSARVADQRERRHQLSDSSYSYDDYSSSSEEGQACPKEAVSSGTKHDAGVRTVVAGSSQRLRSSAQRKVSAHSQALLPASTPLESIFTPPSEPVNAAAAHAHVESSRAFIRELTTFVSLFTPSQPQLQ